MSSDPNQLLLILLEFTEAAACGGGGGGSGGAAAWRFSTADSAARRAPAQTQSMINPQKDQNTGGRTFGLPWHILSSREKIKYIYKKKNKKAPLCWSWILLRVGARAAAAAAEITHGFFSQLTLGFFWRVEQQFNSMCGENGGGGG